MIAQSFWCYDLYISQDNKLSSMANFETEVYELFKLFDLSRQ